MFYNICLTKEKTMNSADLKKKMADKLQKAASKLDSQQKMQHAVSLNISLKTFERYTSGDVLEIRRLELAEKIQAELSPAKEKAAGKM